MYKLEITRIARKAYAKLPLSERRRIDEKLLLLAKNPFADFFDIKKLENTQKIYRLRAGNYRIIYQLIEGKLIINILRIGHRKEVYQ